MIEIIELNTFYLRLKGLMFRKNIYNNNAYLIANCRGIHTCFMMFDINVIGFNRSKEVVEIACVRPWKVKFFEKTVVDIVECDLSTSIDAVVKRYREERGEI